MGRVIGWVLGREHKVAEGEGEMGESCTEIQLLCVCVYKDFFIKKNPYAKKKG